MFTKSVAVVLMFCVVIDVKSEENYRRNYRMPEYVRMKRAKYYSNPPMRFYRLPPPPQPVRGIFSYTPPPNFMDDESPHPGSFRPVKVSKLPPTPDNSLGDDDINNLVKHLSKQDLDKIIEFSGGKYNNPQNSISQETDELNIIKPTLREYDTNKRFSLREPYLSGNAELKNDDYSSGNFPGRTNAENKELFNFVSPYAPSYTSSKVQNLQSSPKQAVYLNRPQKFNDKLQDYYRTFEAQESMISNQLTFINSYIQEELNKIKSQQVIGNDFSQNKVIQEEQLPKPINLRDDDYEVSNTDNVPRVIKTSPYKLENFGNLPLMEYNSKLDTVSSYHVPHYSVISQQPQQSSSPSSSSSSSLLVPSPSSYNIKTPKIEPAPHPSAAKQQSDAHLKAIKIWSHMSKGTAYTLHDDGTLSLEKGGRT